MTPNKEMFLFPQGKQIQTPFCCVLDGDPPDRLSSFYLLDLRASSRLCRQEGRQRNLPFLYRLRRSVSVAVDGLLYHLQVEIEADARRCAALLQA